MLPCVSICHWLVNVQRTCMYCLELLWHETRSLSFFLVISHGFSCIMTLWHLEDSLLLVKKSWRKTIPWCCIRNNAYCLLTECSGIMVYSGRNSVIAFAMNWEATNGSILCCLVCQNIVCPKSTHSFLFFLFAASYSWGFDDK